ncbi:MAG: aminoacyl-tRNA hydrolase [Gemmatimonadota bacterium]|nr:aminoacyl-tRNA hydrolase [Candidatus Binatota bacterium]MDP9179976.1 aminoacyl-tRNA hydrolase [Gemmatimonadota bacterium]
MENWLIVGLGNPGNAYERTRHNLGFMLVDLLARESQTQVKRDECRSLVGRAEIENEKVELAKPQTFMNLSGEAVSCLLKKPDRSVGHLIVISDDLALPFGKIRLRPSGSHGGHNGLRSIIDCLGTNEFVRLRIGIMPEHPVTNSRNFVLENFSKEEGAEVEKILETSADATRAVIRDGIDKAMAEFN